MSRCLAIAVLACGCAGVTAAPASPVVRAAPPVASSPPVAIAPRPLDQDLPRLASRSVQLFDALARALAGDLDCPALAARVDGVATEYADVTLAAARASSARHAGLQHELALHAAELAAAGAAVASSPTLARCARDEAFTHAMDRFGSPT